MSRHPENPIEDRESPIFKLNPKMTMLNMGLMGITALFIGLTIAYLFSSVNWSWNQFGFPKLFLASALILATSSFTLFKAFKSYEKSDESALKTYLLITIGLSLVFVVVQLLGWQELQKAGIFIQGRPNGSFLYLISGLHALHVVAGILPLFLFYVKTSKQLKDPVKSLIFFSNPDTKLQFRIISKYWHFVDFLWIYLLIFFLFNHL